MGTSNKRLAVIGHQPQAFSDLGDGWLWAYNEMARMIVRARHNGFTEYISGMELGFELSASNFIHAKYPDSKLHGIIASVDHQRSWSEGDIGINQSVFEHADTQYIQDTYHVRNLIKRNEKIIVMSDAIILCLRSDVKSGAEMLAAQYAKKKKKQLYWLDPIKKKGIWIVD